jgi:hypothetical protein
VSAGQIVRTTVRVARATGRAYRQSQREREREQYDNSAKGQLRRLEEDARARALEHDTKALKTRAKAMLSELKKLETSAFESRCRARTRLREATINRILK